jgi:hypothetical protein
LTPEALVTTALVLAAVSVSLRLIWWRTLPAGRWKRKDLAWLCLPTVAVTLIGISLTLPGSAALALTTFWLIVLAGEGSMWGWIGYRLRSGSGYPRRSQIDRRLVLPGAGPNHENRAVVVVDSPSETAPATAGSDARLPPEVSQQLIRSLDEDGHETVRAWLRGRFAPGQRATSLHVAFCPPLHSAPRVHVRQLDGAATQVKVAQVLAYGARIDLRLQHFSQIEETVLVELSADLANVAGTASTGDPPARGSNA